MSAVYREAVTAAILPGETVETHSVRHGEHAAICISSPMSLPANRPVLIFDVNETLLDLDTLVPHFAHLFGDGRVLREWFAQLILYSQALTLADAYSDFGELGAATLHMLGEIHDRPISEDAVKAIRTAIAAMPPYPDVEPALEQLQRAGFRMMTLTNNPLATVTAQLAGAGLQRYFERSLSIDESVRQYKPAPATYAWAAAQLGVEVDRCCLIACHTWDTLGATAAGMSSALIRRSGNAPLGVGPQPDLVVAGLAELAAELLTLYPAA